MRSSFVFLLLLFFGSGVSCYSQNHVTIADLSVTYKLPELQLPDSSSTTPKGYPEAILNLVSDTSVSRIYFKIIRPEDLTVVYSVNYSISSGSVTHDNGIVAFLREGNTIHINGLEPVMVIPYNYEITTEDASGHLSSSFIEIH